jgi:hypothetical protein
VVKSGDKNELKLEEFEVVKKRIQNKRENGKK